MAVLSGVLLVAISALSSPQGYAAEPRTVVATVTPHLPKGCKSSEVLDWHQGLTKVKHFLYCVTGGKNVSSAITVCKVSQCGRGNPAARTRAALSALAVPRSGRRPDAGGPSCQVINRDYKYCANGPGNPPKITGLAWRDPHAASGYSYVAPDYSAPHFADPTLAWAKHVWAHVVVRRCTAAALGTAVGTGGIAIVTTGGVGGPVALAMIGGAVGGCITGALNYYWHD